MTTPTADIQTSTLSARNIYHIYRDGKVESVALKGVDLAVEQHSWTSIIGPSGSGKSTLLYILAGLIEPSSGSVFVDGYKMSGMSPSASATIRRNTIGVVLQRNNLYPLLSVRENIELPLKIAGIHPGDRADELLEQVGLAGRSRNFPQQLSGGEVQRVAIAVALACAPEILLADELTGELDEANTIAVLDLLARLRNDTGMSIVTVTHNSVVANRADEQFAMHDGVLTRVKP